MGEEKKRAIILYRMSTDKQDLDTQKRMNRRFCKDNNFEIIDEFSEDGVSGYKNPLEKRPALLTILDKADKHEFDVLVVYIFDRIVRREEEYPIILNHFSKNNVELYSSSTNEKIKAGHTDKLTNYITGWNNEYESIKTSMRVKDAKRNKNEMGKYMGGAAPLGYEIYQTGEINSKNKIMWDMRIKEDDAEIVKLIFDLYLNQNFGVHLIAKKLNEMGIKNRKGNPVRPVTVHRILRNTIYIGRRGYNKSTTTRDSIITNDIEEHKLQPYKEDLRIIDDETFYKVQNLVSNKKVNHTPRNSKNLLSGMVYCGYCNMKLTTDYHSKKQYRKDGSFKMSNSSAFRCISSKLDISSFKHEQKSFGMVKYENTIMEIIFDFVSTIDKDAFFDEISKHKGTNIIDVQKQIATLEKITTDTTKLIQKMELQIDEAILNDDMNKVDILTRRIKSNEDLAAEKRNEIYKLQEQLKSNMNENVKLIDTYRELDSWEERFKEAEMGRQKAMLMRIIDKIYLYKDNVKVVFKLELEQSSVQNLMVNHPSVRDTVPNANDSIIRGYEENPEYVYITISKPIGV